MILKNYEIVEYLNKLEVNFFENDKNFPIGFIFYIKKNIDMLYSKGQEIEHCRHDIGKKYGVYDEKTNSFQIASENISSAQSELDDLLNIEQEIPIVKMKLNSFLDKIDLTYAQMDAIMFMIDEE